MKILTIGVILLSLCSVVEARKFNSNYDIKLLWSIPEMRTDGSILSPDEISHFNIYENGYGVDTVDGVTRKYLVQDLYPDTYCYTVTVVDTNNIESLHSKEVCKTIIEIVPGDQTPVAPNIRIK